MNDNTISNLIVIAKKESNYYTIISTHCLEDKNLSWKAKGIHLYFRSKQSKKWKIRFKALLNCSIDGETSLRAGIKELIDNKYLYHIPIRDEKQVFICWAYISFPEPTDKTEKELKTLFWETPVLENPVVDNKALINNKYSNKKILSKDNISDSSESLNNEISNFLNRWNSLKRTAPIPVHKHPATKTYQKAHALCLQLLKGTFAKDKKFDDEWQKRNKIDVALLNKKWTNVEIYKGFRYLSYLFIEGYWPYDKSKLPKSLSMLLYNPIKGSSFFLTCYNNPPIKFSDQINDKYPQFTEMFLPLFNGDLTIEDKKKLARGVESIIKFHDRFNLKVGVIKDRFRRPLDLCKNFIKYLDEQVTTKIYPGMISANVKTWSNFIERVEWEMNIYECGVDLLKK